jgi:hypothetical protein
VSECVLLKIFLFRRCNICHSRMGRCTHTASSAGHQCPTECMFRLENSSETESLPDVSEFLGSAPNIRDGDNALVYCV